MEEELIRNLSQDDVLDIIKDFPIEPRRTSVIVTLNMHEIESELMLTDNALSEVQYVVAVGEFVKDLKPGQKVILNLEKMMVKEPSPNDITKMVTRVKIDPLEIDGRTFAFIEDMHIKAKDNRI